MHNNPFPLDDEDITDLQIKNLKVLQKKQGFRFSIDAILLAHFAKIQDKHRILDVGTGTAVIPLLLYSRCPNAVIEGLEIQQQMAEMARRTMALNHLTQINIIHDDLRVFSKEHNSCYDVIVSNPPYFPLHMGKISPIEQVALSRHELTCTLEQLLFHSSRLLKSNGRFYLIHRAERLSEILLLCHQYKLGVRRLRLVHPTLTQPANLLLLEAVKGAKSHVKIDTPLAIYDRTGQYTEEILQYYRGDDHD